ncbi:MAG: hypothetical protein H6707_17855 [Deltaproteobacteria bacterium]|nr:hypothetical protein [Deltaproteobacteria bacterium]
MRCNLHRYSQHGCNLRSGLIGLLALLAVCVSTGCSSQSTATTDARRSDAKALDGGVLDGPRGDGQAADATIADAAIGDGAAVDAAAVDGTATDSAIADASSPADGSSMDAKASGPYSWNRASDQLIAAYAGLGGGMNPVCAAVSGKTPCTFVNLMGDGTLYIGGNFNGGLVRMARLCPKEIQALLTQLAPENWKTTPTSYGTAGLCDSGKQALSVDLLQIGQRSLTHAGYCSNTLPSGVEPITKSIQSALSAMSGQLSVQGTDIQPQRSWVALQGPLTAPGTYLPDPQYIHSWPQTKTDPRLYIHSNYNEGFVIDGNDVATVYGLTVDPKTNVRFVVIDGKTYQAPLISEAPSKGVGLPSNCTP